MVPDESTNEVDFSSIDPTVLKAAENGVRLIPTIYGTPPWVAEGLDGNDCGDECAAYAPSSDEALAEWKDFVGQLVDRYGPDGELWKTHAEVDPEPIRTWQIWNEQNSPTFYQPEVDPAGYTKLVESASAAITERDPEAEVILGGMFGTPFQGKPPALSAWEFLRQMYAIEGARDSFDAVAAHPYAAHEGKIEAQVARIHEEVQHADDNAGLWITEVGASSDEGKNPLEMGPEGQAEQLRGRVRVLHRPARGARHRGGHLVLVARLGHPPVRLVRRVGPVRGGLADAEAGLGRVRLVHRRVLTHRRAAQGTAGVSARPPSRAGSRPCPSPRPPSRAPRAPGRPRR